MQDTQNAISVYYYRRMHKQTASFGLLFFMGFSSEIPMKQNLRIEGMGIQSPLADFVL